MAKKGIFQIMKETIVNVAASIKMNGGRNIGKVVNNTLDETKKREFENGDDNNSSDSDTRNSNNN